MPRGFFLRDPLPRSFGARAHKGNLPGDDGIQLRCARGVPRDVEPDVLDEIGVYWDDANGGYLEPKLVRAARAEERKAIKS